MDKKDLKIGDEVYTPGRYHGGRRMGKIIGETSKYWKIQFGDTSPTLFAKDTLRKRGGSTWNNTCASTLTDDLKKEIITERKIMIINNKIRDFQQRVIIVNSVEVGEKILEMLDKVTQSYPNQKVVKKDE